MLSSLTTLSLFIVLSLPLSLSLVPPFVKDQGSFYKGETGQLLLDGQ